MSNTPFDKIIESIGETAIMFGILTFCAGFMIGMITIVLIRMIG